MNTLTTTTQGEFAGILAAHLHATGDLELSIWMSQYASSWCADDAFFAFGRAFTEAARHYFAEAIPRFVTGS